MKELEQVFYRCSNDAVTVKWWCTKLGTYMQYGENI